MASHQARKRFGQNFLVDQAVIDAIVNAIDPASHERVIEIGPGLSALTEPLLDRLSKLTAIEIDRDLAGRLRSRFSDGKLDVIEADALQVDFSSFGSSLRIVGIVDQHFMLQREVVDRMVALAGTADFSRLSVMLQYRYKMTKLFDVDPSAFDPPPRVVSSIVRMVPLGPGRVRAANERLFAEIVARAFSQRRKMLRGVLSEWVSMIPWSDLGIEPTLRAEAVPVSAYVGMADALHGLGITSLAQR